MRRAFLILSLLVLVSLFFGCVQQKTEKVDEKIKVTDLAGRTVEVPKKVERVVAIGPGALRILVYLQVTDKVVGVENAEKAWETYTRPYRLANPQLANLSTIGVGGPDDPKPNVEEIIKLKPDVIFAVVSAQYADNLQEKTGIPVVVLNYGVLGNFRTTELFESIKLAGKILNKEERAKEIVSYIERVVIDLNERTKGIEKPKVYVGALGFKGQHGFTSTQCRFPPFEVNNVYSENIACKFNTTILTPFMIDREFILKEQPDVIFLDLGNLFLVKKDYEKDKAFYQSLKAFREERVYGIYSFNFYNTNVEQALVNSYWIGKVLMPEKFKDVNIREKANEIYKFFVGKELYDEIASKYGELGKINVSSW
ncbi:MAG: iron ABC transporter substrate-binding protein [Archaeoglobaceae archaeon]|nr:iron ABC transporter substrate-binding protein [Archaeoglobaceae archaeon]MCX8152755.1 iron ABC transporter substrate-binding protein [Archaeoglobaceae archaeon]MDW8013462.1 iron ABC transporter substrate-binding protein [Archaeoglobaceae archaeon]